MNSIPECSALKRAFVTSTNRAGAQLREGSDRDRLAATLVVLALGLARCLRVVEERLARRLGCLGLILGTGRDLTPGEFAARLMLGHVLLVRASVGHGSATVLALLSVGNGHGPRPSLGADPNFTVRR